MSIKAQLAYPGTISLASAAGQFPGCTAKWFWTVGGFRRFFTESPTSEPHGWLVVETKYVPYMFGLLVGVAVLYTKQLSPAEDAEMREVTRRIQHEVGEIRQRQAEEAMEAQAVKEAAEAEVQRLAQVGTKYEARVAHARTLAPSSAERKGMESIVNAGDYDILFTSREDAFKAGFVHGVRAGEATKATKAGV